MKKECADLNTNYLIEKLKENLLRFYDISGDINFDYDVMWNVMRNATSIEHLIFLGKKAIKEQNPNWVNWVKKT
jgi:hypothetical protein